MIPQLMSKFIVTVLDGTKARFFTLEEATFPEYESGPKLVERGDQIDSAKKMLGRDLWANVKTGRARGFGTQSYPYDDRRQQHVTEFEKCFAHTVVDEVLRLAKLHGAGQLVLVAEPQILGNVREALTSQMPATLQVAEVAKDLCKHTPQKIHEYLAAQKLLPARKPAVGMSSETASVG
jgi:protein required for attachment to host cells